MDKETRKEGKRPQLWKPKTKLADPLDNTWNGSHSCVPSASDARWPGWPRASPAGAGPPHTDRPWRETQESKHATTGMHKLLVAEVAKLGSRPSELVNTGNTNDQYRADNFAESCIMSLALWRRFGSLDFAQSLGWIERCDYAAMCAVTDRVVEAAVRVWKAGKHAVVGCTRAQKSTREIEEQAWHLGNGNMSARGFSQMGLQRSSAGDERRLLRDAELGLTLSRSWHEALKSSNELASLRVARVTPAGEASVRAAYTKLLNAIHHPIWDLWHKRQVLAEAALKDCNLETLQNLLLGVKGYCGPDPDGEYAGWELAFDIMTMTPLSPHNGPLDWCGDYVTWFRERKASESRSDSSRFSRTSPRPPRRRQLVSSHLEA